MAREVGLEAVSVDVTSIEAHLREAEVIVNNGHVTAGILVEADIVIIDFTRTPEREYIGYKIIDDLEAIANYYNNQGFLYGYFTETEGQKLDFDPLEKELELVPGLPSRSFPPFSAPATIRCRLQATGRVQEAIEQYNMAIEVDPSFPEAHANLGAAYYALGRTEDAFTEFQIAATHAGSNGYFHHFLESCSISSGNTKKPSRSSERLFPRSRGWQRRGTISASAT